MDCQMPEMDGYEATRAIRDPSSAVRNHDVPIVAMTANAMKGDCEACLAAGMDDYVPKPIKVQQLAAVIERNLPGGSQSQERSAPSSQTDVADSSASIDHIPDEIHSELANDSDLSDVIDQFVSRLPRRVEEMRQALDNGDYDQLRRLAHQLKGAGGSYGYPSLNGAAVTLEDAAKAEDVEATKLALAKLTALSRSAARGRNALKHPA